MNSKQRVAAALGGNGNYDRLPMWYGAEPNTTQNVLAFLSLGSEEELCEYLGIDFRTIRPRYIGPELKRYADGTFDTMWGIRRGGGFWGTALNTPLAHADSIQTVDAYPFPCSQWFDVRFTDQDRRLSRDYCIIGGMWSPFWHDAMELLGLEKMFIDMKFNPSLVEAVVDKCFEFYYGLSAQAFEVNRGLIDIFWFANDFGTQNGLIIDPRIAKFFKPKIALLSDLGHRHGLKVAMHSCGDIHQIIPDLIEIGIEILNPIQVSAANMDPIVLKRQYGKDIVFFGTIDYNHVLNYGTEQSCATKCGHYRHIGPRWKVHCRPSHDLLMPEVPARNIWAMYDEGVKYSAQSRMTSESA